MRYYLDHCVLFRYKLDRYVRSNQPNFLPHDPIFIITDLQPVILPLLGHLSRSHLVIYIYIYTPP